MKNTIRQGTKKTKNNLFNIYLDKQKGFSTGISQGPSENLNYCIVIPCYNEPNLSGTLDSLRNNRLPDKDTEVIIVVNSPENSEKEVHVQNSKTIKEIEAYQLKHNTKRLQFHYVNYPNVPVKVAGAGYARKKGMDEAVARFASVNNANGIIISLDADTTCDINYLTHIEAFYNKFPEANGCNIYFEHDLGSIDEISLKKGIISYELYLRYYTESLKFAGFPYFFHTIGSCFSVKAMSYCKQGGMGIKLAGEDFYFLQKIFYLDNYYEINSTVVYPSVRISNRAIFGTGPALSKMDINGPYKVYAFEIFGMYKQFFADILKFYGNPDVSYDTIKNYSIEFQNYLESINFMLKLNLLRKNTASFEMFNKKFFQIFNNFFIIKGLNYLSEKGYPKQPVLDEVNKLLLYLKNKTSNNEKDALIQLRDIQKRRGITFPL